MSQNRREHPRIDLRAEVHFSSQQSFYIEYTRNISRGGIFIKTDQLPDRNSVIALAIYLPIDDQPIRVLGRVVRTVSVSDPERTGSHLHGIGVQFFEWYGDGEQRLKTFVQDLLSESEQADEG